MTVRMRYNEYICLKGIHMQFWIITGFSKIYLSTYEQRLGDLNSGSVIHQPHASNTELWWYTHNSIDTNNFKSPFCDLENSFSLFVTSLKEFRCQPLKLNILMKGEDNEQGLKHLIISKSTNMARPIRRYQVIEISPSNKWTGGVNTIS